MNIAKIFLENNPAIGKVITALDNLPSQFRPLYFSDSENKIDISNNIADTETFNEFQKNNKFGFFLFTKEKVKINITLREENFSEITVYFTEDFPEYLISDYVSCLTALNPFFGFACEYEEYKHRNRYYKMIGINEIEDWVGRDLNKYISGVYWITLFSEKILDKHDVDINELYFESTSCKNLNKESVHLLKFYEKPRDWKDNITRLDNICEKKGFFSKYSIDIATNNVDRLFEYDEIISQWR